MSGKRISLAVLIAAFTWIVATTDVQARGYPRTRAYSQRVYPMRDYGPRAFSPRAFNPRVYSPRGYGTFAYGPRANGNYGGTPSNLGRSIFSSGVRGY